MAVGLRDKKSGIPDKLLRHAHAMHNYGTQRGIDEFLKPEEDLDQVNGYMLSVVGCGIMSANAYCRGPYNGGALYMLIDDPQNTKHSSNPLNIIAIGFPKAVRGFPIPRHMDALVGYAGSLGLSAQKPDTSTVVISGDNCGTCTAIFDDQGRMKHIKAMLEKSSISYPLECERRAQVFARSIQVVSSVLPCIAN